MGSWKFGLFGGDYSVPVKKSICLRVVASFKQDIMVVCYLVGL